MISSDYKINSVYDSTAWEPILQNLGLLGPNQNLPRSIDPLELIQRAGMEQALLSPEAQMLAGMPQSQDTKDTEETKAADKKKENALAEIDQKVMNLLRELKQEPVLKEIGIQNFDKAREMATTAPWHGKKEDESYYKPSLIVLRLLGSDSRLPIRFQQEFSDLARRMQQILEGDLDEKTNPWKSFSNLATKESAKVAAS